MFSALRRHPAGLHLGLMLALTFSTGIADAVGYLGLDRVFTGNMTGNVVILGMALAGADGLQPLGPVIALLCFMAGAAIAGRALRTRAVGWSSRTTWLFGTVAIVLVAAGVAALLLPADRPEWLLRTITGAIALAMGIQAGAARQVAVKDVTTVVVTSTLVGFAFDSPLGMGGGQPWARRLGAIVLIGAGAAVGALLLRLGLGWGVLLSAAITVVVTVLGALGSPRPAKA